MEDTAQKLRDIPCQIDELADGVQLDLDQWREDQDTTYQLRDRVRELEVEVEELNSKLQELLVAPMSMEEILKISSSG